jgi:hypothetical protein
MESKFDKLYKEAFEDENFDFGSEEGEGQDMEFGDGDVNVGDEEGNVGDNDVVGELLSIKDQIEGLLTQLGYEGEEEGEEEVGDDLGDDNEVGGDEDIEDLEREAVEYEDVSGKEEELQKKSNQKASPKTGDLDKETSKKHGMERNYKFVKVNKPEEKKYNTTKGS